MSKVWVHVEPDKDGNPVYIRYTEEQILKEYYDFWCYKTRKAGRTHLITERECIKDWVAIHWSWEEE